MAQGAWTQEALKQEDCINFQKVGLKTISPEDRFQNVMHALGRLLKDRHVQINEARTCYAQLLDEWKEYQAWLNGEDVREVVDDPEIPF